MQAVAESYAPADLTASAPPSEATMPGYDRGELGRSPAVRGTPAERRELAAYASPLTHVHSFVGVPEPLWPGIASMG